MNHEKYMRRCIELAVHGLGRVAPNPLVGAVLVKDELIIGEGYHRNFGEAHAEVNAIASVDNTNDLKQSTLYVNLEPCAHFGKTPPCADLVIKWGIPRVVIGMNDPNPKVAGEGIKRLREAGIEVITGVLEDESHFLNRRFIAFHIDKRPYIILKWAQSADGFMDRTRIPGEPRRINWISSPATKKLVHLWRSQEQAILVGRNTVVLDDPSLTVREVEGRNPTRIVFEGRSLVPKESKIFQDKTPTLVYSLKESSSEGRIEVKKLPEDALNDLYRQGISSVLVEGGAATIQSFLDSGLWDEARMIQSGTIIGSGQPAPVFAPTAQATTQIYGADTIRTYYRV